MFDNGIGLSKYYGNGSGGFCPVDNNGQYVRKINSFDMKSHLGVAITIIIES